MNSPNARKGLKNGLWNFWTLITTFEKGMIFLIILSRKLVLIERENGNVRFRLGRLNWDCLIFIEYISNQTGLVQWTYSPRRGRGVASPQRLSREASGFSFSIRARQRVGQSAKPVIRSSFQILPYLTYASVYPHWQPSYMNLFKIKCEHRSLPYLK